MLSENEKKFYAIIFTSMAFSLTTINMYGIADLFDNIPPGYWWENFVGQVRNVTPLVVVNSNGSVIDEGFQARLEGIDKDLGKTINLELYPESLNITLGSTYRLDWLTNAIVTSSTNTFTFNYQQYVYYSDLRVTEIQVDPSTQPFMLAKLLYTDNTNDVLRFELKTGDTLSVGPAHLVSGELKTGGYYIIYIKNGNMTKLVYLEGYDGGFP